MLVKQNIINIFLIFLGSLLMAVSFVVFIIPNNLLAGGVTGLAILTNHFTGLPIAAMVLLYNIPIIIWARKELTPRFIIYTICSIVAQSFFLAYLKNLSPYTNDRLLAGIFGGILGGSGTGLLIKHSGSTGGVDVISIVLKKRLGISIGTVSFMANAIIIGLTGIIYGPEPAMYTLVSLFAGGQTMDFVQEGLNRKHTVMIVSNKSANLKTAILYQLERGVTLVHGSGGFENIEKDIIFCVVNQFELARLKEIVNSVDESAFMTISETSEVLGRFSQHSFSWKSNKS